MDGFGMWLDSGANPRIHSKKKASSNWMRFRGFKQYFIDFPKYSGKGNECFHKNRLPWGGDVLAFACRKTRRSD